MRGAVDLENRCEHYALPLDIVAIKFPCCGEYYPCYECHENLADHKAERWKRFDVPAILCGVCKSELLIEEYLCGDFSCPHCQSLFNPGCKNHFALYFDL